MVHKKVHYKATPSNDSSNGRQILKKKIYIFLDLWLISTIISASFGYLSSFEISVIWNNFQQKGETWIEN